MKGAVTGARNLVLSCAWAAHRVSYDTTITGKGDCGRLVPADVGVLTLGNSVSFWGRVTLMTAAHYLERRLPIASD